MKFKYLVCLLLFSVKTLAQNTIHLRNPSFEDRTQVGMTPKAWYDCGFPNETPPDIHSGSSKYFGVNNSPSDGETYIGMVTRDNDTWEAVGQRLSTPMLGNQSYRIDIDLCKSATYQSISRKTNQPELYTTPIVLKIWGGDGYCQKKELLGSSPTIKNTQWITNSIILTPKSDIEYITFEVHYNAPVLFPTNGNILLDNCSPIVPFTNNENVDSIDMEKISETIIPRDPVNPSTSQKNSPHETKQAIVAKSNRIINSKKITDIENYPMLSTIDNIEEFFAYTDNYMMLSFFKKSSYKEMEALRLSMLEVGTNESAAVLLQGMELFYIYGVKTKMSTLEKKTFLKLDDAIEVAKTHDNLSKKMSQFIEENLDSFAEEVQNFNKSN